MEAGKIINKEAVKDLSFEEFAKATARACRANKIDICDAFKELTGKTATKENVKNLRKLVK